MKKEEIKKKKKMKGRGSEWQEIKAKDRGRVWLDIEQMRRLNALKLSKAHEELSSTQIYHNHNRNQCLSQTA